MLQLLSEVADFFGASRYAAHSICLSSDQALVNLYVLSDGVIALSYYIIGGILIANRASVVRFLRFIFFDPTMLTLFGLFIVFCASTHVTMLLTLYFGVYYLDLFAKLATAGISAATAYRTIIAFYVEHKLPSIVEALEIPEAPGADRFLKRSS
jgi:two-component system NtrC family sensor kinase